MAKGKKQSEQMIIKLTMIINLIGAFFCFWVGWRNFSNAMIFDTIYCLLLSMGYFGTLYLHRHVLATSTIFFPFGFHKLQPMIVIFQSCLIIMACIVSIVHMIFQLSKHQYVTDYAEIIIFQGFFLLVCCIIYFKIYKFNKKHKSKIIKIIALNWLLDIFLSIAFIVGFLFALLLEKTAFHEYAHYIDPIGLILLIIFIIPEPLKVIKDSIIELLDGTQDVKPFLKIQNDFKTRIRKYNPKMKIDKIICRLAGNKLFVYVLFLQDGDFEKKHLVELCEFLKKDVHDIEYQVEIIIGFSSEITRKSK